MAEVGKVNWIKAAALWICAGLLGKFLGFLGLGSAILGYFTYKKMLESKDKVTAVMVAISVGVGFYILVILVVVAK
jgi:uncharacterized membrane protein